MKRILWALALTTLLLTACNEYGEKVAINPKSEVYYKGDGVTEADAKKLGNFLLAQNFFNTTDERSVQLTKDSGAYVVRIVVDKDKITGNKEEVLTSFKVWQMWIADNVFPNAATKLVLTDNEFKDMEPVGAFSDEEKRALFTDDATTAADTSATKIDVAPTETSLQ